ncbi:MAG TPA: polysaccharide deacetylase family protein [Thermoanaerobaculia bacterium]|nr:polysaccharide deacetylase family protein [Thermoanaerobaculia bacterium]
MSRLTLVTSALVALSSIAIAQRVPEEGERKRVPSLVERLGHPPDAKLLIIHADDLGMNHSINAASVRALESGAINSASIMVPCPWFPEIAAYARKNPDADFGLHLTLTSEWVSYRWGPVLPATRVPTLLDPSGYLHPTEVSAAAAIDPREAEAEIRAQIDRARAFGIEPTHLDTHMRTLHQTPELFAALLRVSRETGIPAAINRDLASDPDFAPLLGPGDVVIDRFVSIGPEVAAESWAEYYADAIRSLEPGVTELIVHVAFDDAEMRAATGGVPGWGSGWRQRDLDVLSSDAFRRLLRENQVRLITWREIGALMARPAP